ncbi:MAG: NAD(P)(+) transhydrogenase (Re/Si-specific) subunit beta [Ktedonobacteraceae bacterium]|nr:NAD(P)(+) transhydrogenase (Re/Si-specific) subunit beta [Ktedonobacteraceae bacterium]
MVDQGYRRPPDRLAQASGVALPILNADEARNIVFLKRSMRPGFAGIDNELFYNPRTIMLFGDARESLTKLVAAVKGA